MNLALLKENPLVRITTFKDLLIALYGTVGFLLCTIVVFGFGKAQDQPLSTLLLVAILGSCAVFLVSLLLNLPRPDKYRVLGLVLLLVFFFSMELFFMWYSHDDQYSIFVWNGLIVIVLFTVTNLDRTFDPKRVKDIERALYYIVVVGLVFFGLWMLLFSYLWLTDEPVFQQELVQNTILASYVALGLFWLYWEILSLRIRERITRETVLFLKKYGQKSVAETLVKTPVASLKRGHQLSMQVIQAIKNVISQHPPAKSEGVMILENWRQHFGTTLEAMPDRTLLTLILSTFSEISARSQLRAILHDDQACCYEKMIAFRELTDLSLEEKGTVDPFEYLPPFGDNSTTEVYKVLIKLIKVCLASTEPRRYMGAMHKLDSLLYQFLHDGIKHIVANQLETQLEIGDLRNSKADLNQIVALSHTIFGSVDELLDAPLFAPNRVRLEQYVNQTDLPAEDRVRLTVVYARKLAKKCRFLRELIRKQHTHNVHQLINTVIEQNRVEGVDMIREFARSRPTVTPETDAAFDIICEENLIHQALVNLAVNAITAMADSPIKQLTFQTELATAEVTVKVTDTGCGISAERKPRLFTEGSGLKIAKSNIEIHAGSLKLERSEVGAGSRFAITLPRKSPSMR